MSEEYRPNPNARLASEAGRRVHADRAMRTNLLELGKAIEKQARYVQGIKSIEKAAATGDTKAIADLEKLGEIFFYYHTIEEKKLEDYGGYLKQKVAEEQKIWDIVDHYLTDES